MTKPSITELFMQNTRLKDFNADAVAALRNVTARLISATGAGGMIEGDAEAIARANAVIKTCTAHVSTPPTNPSTHATKGTPL